VDYVICNADAVHEPQHGLTNQCFKGLQFNDSTRLVQGFGAASVFRGIQQTWQISKQCVGIAIHM
jgi:hypothetical protein